MNNTEINWTQLTWNPVSGCTKVSDGCRYCYAQTIAENKRGTAAFPAGFDMTFRHHKLIEPTKIKEPSLIFANSMSDFFHPEIPAHYRDWIFEVIESNPRHRFQVLTKRPDLAVKYFQSRSVPGNIWMGATVENTAAKLRIDLLRQIDAKIRFLSIEPLLDGLGDLDFTGIHWVIAGGESGHHLMDPAIRSVRALVDREKGHWTPRTDRADWVRSIRDQCISQDVAFWFKQWGGSFGHLAGRELDGMTWNQFPAAEGAMPDGYAHRNKRIALSA